MSNGEVVPFQKQNPGYAAPEEEIETPLKQEVKKETPRNLSPLEQALQNRKNKAVNRAAARGNAVSDALRSSANASQNLSNEAQITLAKKNIRTAKKELSQAKPAPGAYSVQPSAPGAPESKTIEAINQNSEQNKSILMQVLESQHKIYELLKEIVTRKNKNGNKQNKQNKQNVTRKK